MASGHIAHLAISASLYAALGGLHVYALAAVYRHRGHPAVNVRGKPFSLVVLLASIWLWPILNTLWAGIGFPSDVGVCALYTVSNQLFISLALSALAYRIAFVTYKLASLDLARANVALTREVSRHKLTAATSTLSVATGGADAVTDARRRRGSTSSPAPAPPAPYPPLPILPSQGSLADLGRASSNATQQQDSPSHGGGARGGGGGSQDLKVSVLASQGSVTSQISTPTHNSPRAAELDSRRNGRLGARRIVTFLHGRIEWLAGVYFCLNFLGFLWTGGDTAVRALVYGKTVSFGECQSPGPVIVITLWYVVALPYSCWLRRVSFNDRFRIRLEIMGLTLIFSALFLAYGLVGAFAYCHFRSLLGCHAENPPMNDGHWAAFSLDLALMLNCGLFFFEAYVPLHVVWSERAMVAEASGSYEFSPSLEDVLTFKPTFEMFQRHLVEEWSPENLAFYTVVTRYELYALARAAQRPQPIRSLRRRALAIYWTYVHPSAVRLVNLSAEAARDLHSHFSTHQYRSVVEASPDTYFAYASGAASFDIAPQPTSVHVSTAARPRGRWSPRGSPQRYQPGAPVLTHTQDAKTPLKNGENAQTEREYTRSMSPGAAVASPIAPALRKRTPGGASEFFGDTVPYSRGVGSGAMGGDQRGVPNSEWSSTASIFARAKAEILTLMEEDSYRRFLRRPEVQTALAQSSFAFSETKTGAMAPALAPAAAEKLILGRSPRGGSPARTSPPPAPPSSGHPLRWRAFSPGRDPSVSSNNSSRSVMTMPDGVPRVATEKLNVTEKLSRGNAAGDAAGRYTIARVHSPSTVPVTPGTLGSSGGSPGSRAFSNPLVGAARRKERKARAALSPRTRGGGAESGGVDSADSSETERAADG